MNAERKERFRCPFFGKGKCNVEEHSVGDCGVDVTLNKVMEIFAEGVERHSESANSDLSSSQGEDAPTGIHEEKPGDSTSASGREPDELLLKAYLLAESGELKYSEDVLPIESQGEDIDLERKDQRFLQHLIGALRNELDCQVCYGLLLNPFTTSCGHTFCQDCALRVLDHSNLCPICRRANHRVGYTLGQPDNENISGIIARLFPEHLESRQESTIKEEGILNDSSTIPLFVCTLAFPTMPVYLHVFEPRYRLMMRRALENGGRKFGMVMFNKTGIPQGDMGVTQFMQFGTLLYIDRFELLPDGRSLIEARGLSRFKVIDWEMQDGYFVGKTEPIEDISLASEEDMEVRETENLSTSPRPGNPDPDMEQLDHLSTEELMKISTDFVSRRKAESARWLHQRVLTAYGEPPSDPAVFSYWFGCVLPIFEEERYSLLSTVSVRERLKITAMWVKVLEDIDST